MKRVLLYTMQGNADGEAALAFLQARGLRVDVRDVGRDGAATLECFDLAGRLAIPTLVIDGRVFVGFGPNREEIEPLLHA